MNNTNQVTASFAYEDVARICHEANKAYCNTIGDYSQPDWEDAPDWQKDSAINGVRFHYLNDNTTPADSHKSWLKEKEEQGWKYGEIKDPEKKEHPCFTAYENLPKSQQVKDYIFKAIVDAHKQAFYTPVMTRGMELVGYSFNPSNLPQIDKAKKLSADLIDMVLDDHDTKTMAGSLNATWNRNILKTLAVTTMIQAQMAVVKILTWNK